MKLRIVDEHALASPSPRNVRLYLRSRGWERPTVAPAKPDVWERPADEGTYEVIAPSNRAARDFPARIGELLRTLSIVEDRSELEILRDIATLSFDIQYIRMLHDGTPGTAPIEDASDALSAAETMLAAAATAVEHPRLVLPTRRPRSTMEFIQKVLAGPTAEGSYVMSIWVPVPPRLTQEEDSILFDATDEPFERTATKQLLKATRAVRQATEEALQADAGLDAFIGREADGVSANLCEALVKLGGEDETGFQIAFAWALDRPVIDPEPVVRFENELLPVVKEAARELRAQLPEEDVRIRGNVVRLHREGQLGHGEVTIAGIVSDDLTERLRRVNVDLSEEDYAKAIQAHESFSDVEIVGSLLQRGTRTYLRDARGFIVLPSPS